MLKPAGTAKTASTTTAATTRLRRRRFFGCGAGCAGPCAACAAAAHGGISRSFRSGRRVRRICSRRCCLGCRKARGQPGKFGGKLCKALCAPARLHIHGVLYKKAQRVLFARGKRRAVHARGDIWRHSALGKGVQHRTVKYTLPASPCTP